MQSVDLAMQCIQGHILFSMIPRHGEEGLSQVAQTQVGQEHWCWGQNILHLLSSLIFALGALNQLYPVCDREEARWHITGLWGAWEWGGGRRFGRLWFGGVILRYELSCAPAVEWNK